MLGNYHLLRAYNGNPSSPTAKQLSLNKTIDNRRKVLARLCNILFPRKKRSNLPAPHAERQTKRCRPPANYDRRQSYPENRNRKLTISKHTVIGINSSCRNSFILVHRSFLTIEVGMFQSTNFINQQLHHQTFT